MITVTCDKCDKVLDPEAPSPHFSVPDFLGPHRSFTVYLSFTGDADWGAHLCMQCACELLDMLQVPECT